MRRWLAAAVAAAALTACGSTVQLGAGGAPQQSDELALTQPGAGAAPRTGVGGTTTGDLSVPSSGGQAVLKPGSSPGAVAGSGTRGSAVAAPNAASGSALPSNAPVRVGVMYLKDASAAGAALGINGLETGDTEAQAKAVANWMNAHGGAAGHKIVLYFAGITAQQTEQNPQLAQQAACAQLTQDNKVQFVVTYLNLLPGTMDCFAKASTSVIDDLSNLADWEQQKYSNIFAAPGDFAPGRMLRELVDALWRTGWLTKTSKVGAYGYDNPDNRRLVDQSLAQALAAHGLKIAKEEYVTNDANGVAQTSNVSLQFRAAGVDRIIPVLASPLFIMEAAASQGYHPAYAMYSAFGPGALMETAAPKDQLANSRGIGWSPYLDIGRGTHPGPVNANETLCFNIYKKAGQGSSSATTKGLQLNLCSVLLYLKFAADRAKAVTSELLGQARPLVRASFPPPDTFRSDMSRHSDGAAGYRDIAYEQNCGCYQYVSAVHLTSG